MSENVIVDLSDLQTSIQVREVLIAICSVAQDLSQRISLGPINGKLDGAVGTNSDGDSQKALDVIADDAYFEALRNTSVRWYASEEKEDVVSLNLEGTLALAIDPLDGSSNINSNVSIGTIFGIYPAARDPNLSFLRKGRDLVAAGYIIFGPQTSLVVTVGSGVEYFVLDRNKGFFSHIGKMASIPNFSTEYAINSSNFRYWEEPMKSYIRDCNLGEIGPFKSNFNMRWIASLVAEAHRILIRGGIFLYPADARHGYENGRLRMVYECAPIAYIIEQAGGLAKNAIDPILDQVPDSLHARSPFSFGSSGTIEHLVEYHLI